MSEQYIRVPQLLVKDLKKGIDLSALQFSFEVNASDYETPNNVVIRIYNMNPETSRLILGEFTQVILGAGYKPEGPREIFNGTIKQVRRGRQNATDTYTEIIAADSDVPYNNTVLNAAIPAGATWTDQQTAILRGMSANGVNSVYAPGVPLGPALPRGKTYFGMARAYARDLANTMGCSWSLQQGTSGADGKPTIQLTFSRLKGYLPGEVVVLTSQTGMIGLPEQTENGIEVRCLLNPRIKPGTAVRIDNKSIQTQRINPQYNAINNRAALAADGIYKVLVVEHTGDTRGNDWYTDLTCLAISPSASAGNVGDPVKPYFAGPGGTVTGG